MTNRLVYATLLQIEYVLALVAGVLVGGKHWLIAVIALVLTCVLGFGTTWLYWKLIDSVNKERKC